MRTHKGYRRWVWAPLIAVPFLSAAAEDPVSRIRVDEPKRNTDRFSVSYSPAWNISARFSGIGNGAGQNPNLPSASGVNRTYDDGYVLRDRYYNEQENLTANFGYRDNSQFQSAGQNQPQAIFLHSSSVTPTKSDSVSDDPQHGFQLTWNHEFGRDKKDRLRWGIEGAFGWNDIRFHDTSPLRAGTSRITDRYDTGTNPNQEPYWNPETQSGHRGNEDSFGPLIAMEIANREVTSNPNGALVFGDRSFNADLFFFHLGPYLEIPITKKLHAVVSGGLAFGVMAGEYGFTETVVVPRASVTERSGEESDTDALIGAYVSASLLYNIDNNWGVFVGGQFQTMTDYHMTVNNRKVSVDFGATPFLTAGVSYSF